MPEIIDVAAIVLAGLMVGCELSVGLFVHPVLNKLPNDVHLPAASALARVLGRFMPFWYALVTLLTVVEVVIQWWRSGDISVWFTVSAILWLLTIVFSITMLVPINDRIASWANSAAPSDWKTFRNRWDLLHRWRVVILTTAFVFLIVGVVRK